MKNNKGQMIVFNIMALVIVVVVFTALIPVLTDVLKNARGSDGLNCVSTKSVCSSSAEPCYNVSLESQTTSCLVLDIYLPYIIIVVLLMSVAALMAGRSDMFGMGGQQQQPQF